jgi:hypothetical protein
MFRTMIFDEERLLSDLGPLVTPGNMNDHREQSLVCWIAKMQRSSLPTRMVKS